jgi:endonuclease/exonuclease/phosphatase family metal-dependent hydrolase
MTQEPDQADGYDNRILYDKRRVELVDFGSEIYPPARQAPDDTERWWTWATFRHKWGNHPSFLFATTHLSPNSDAVDELQWAYLAYQAKKLGQAKNVPVIIVGDFNSTKFEPPSQDMLKYMYNSGFGDVLGQTYRSYATYKPRAKQKIDAWIGSSNRGQLDMRTFSVSKDRNSNSIDWVFASNHLQVPRYRVYAQYTYPYLKSPLPSDHQLVTAVISLP